MAQRHERRALLRPPNKYRLDAAIAAKIAAEAGGLLEGHPLYGDVTLTWTHDG